MVTIQFEKLYPDVELPRHYSALAAGLDLSAYIKTEENRRSKVLIPPNTVRNIRTGLAAEIVQPHGERDECDYYMQVVSRSGYASRCLFVANAPGIVDPDYRGELCVLLYNGGHQSQYIEHGDRVAQLIVAPFLHTIVVEVAELSPTERGCNGFGSTGK